MADIKRGIRAGLLTALLTSLVVVVPAAIVSKLTVLNCSAVDCVTADNSDFVYSPLFFIGYPILMILLFYGEGLLFSLLSGRLPTRSSVIKGMIISGVVSLLFLGLSFSNIFLLDFITRFFSLLVLWPLLILNLNWYSPIFVIASVLYLLFLGALLGFFWEKFGQKPRKSK
jgi:hypothetical protein